MITLSSFF